MSQEYKLTLAAAKKLQKKFKQVVRRLKKGKKITSTEKAVLIKVEKILCVSVSRFALRWMHDFVVEDTLCSLQQAVYSDFNWGRLGFAFDDLVLVVD